MGIQGLLPYVKKSCRPCKITEFRDCAVAVDACCWLHRGVFGCADKLALGQRTDFYVHYCVKYVKSLLSHGCRVILVFDGASLPAKKQTNETRKQRREEAREKGHRLHAEGNHNEATNFFRQSIDITFEMVTDVIDACKSLGPNVQCIVAPYEADAQLGYLNLNGFVDIVVSEDSDLIVFGCNKIIFKFDQYGGLLYEKDKLPLVWGNAGKNFDFANFRRACILSGCDYTNGLAGMGLVKATRFFQKVTSSANRDLKSCLKRIPLVMNMPKAKVTDDFLEEFINAENTFLHQLVFDPEHEKLVPLTSYKDGIKAEHLPYAGRLLDDELAKEISAGNVCPRTHQRRKTTMRRSPAKFYLRPKAKSPAKVMVKTPKKLRISPAKTAFQTTHVRSVTTVQRSPKKIGISRSSLSTSATVAMYGYETMTSEVTLTRSRYFACPVESKEDTGNMFNATSPQHENDPVVEIVDLEKPGSQKTPSIRKKRSIFDCLVNDDGGISEESGYFDGSILSNSPSTPISSSLSPSSSKSMRRYESKEDSVETAPSLLSNFTAHLTQFRYNAVKVQREKLTLPIE